MLGKLLIGQDRYAELSAGGGNCALLESNRSCAGVLPHVPNQTTVAASEIEPAYALEATEQSFDDPGDPAPFVLTHRPRWRSQLKAVVNERIRPLTRVVAIVVNALELGPGIGNERKPASIAAPELVVTPAVAAVDRAQGVRPGAAQTASVAVRAVPEIAQGGDGNPFSLRCPPEPEGRWR